MQKLEMAISTEDAQRLACADTCLEYSFVDHQYLGEWRWGNEYRVIFIDVEGNYWGFEYKESVGDNYWSSIDESEANFVICYAYRPVEVTTTTYKRVVE